jgi:hypothetical protein
VEGRPADLDVGVGRLHREVELPARLGHQLVVDDLLVAVQPRPVAGTIGRGAAVLAGLDVDADLVGAVGELLTGRRRGGLGLGGVSSAGRVVVGWVMRFGSFAGRAPLAVAVAVVVVPKVFGPGCRAGSKGVEQV